MRNFKSFLSQFLFVFVIMCPHSHAAYRLLELHVDSEGDDGNPASEELPIKSLGEAQSRANAFIGNLSPNTTHKDDYIKVRIIVSGTFYGQSFSWDHPHQSVHLDFKAADGKDAVFYGYRHPEFNSEEGPTFFSAHGRSSSFKKYKGYSGYGTVSVRGLTIKYYGQGFYVSAWEDTKPTNINISGNTFYKVGQIAHPEVWAPRFSAITFNTIDNAIVTKNNFISIGNNPDDYPELMHGLYIVNSDQNIITDNYFDNISGEPVKIRNGSDYNQVLQNTFKKGLMSAHIFPVQNWYAEWWKSDEEWLATHPDTSIAAREIPSFANTISNNIYLNGYVNSLFTLTNTQKEAICRNRTYASPTVLPLTYTQAATQSKTNARLIIDGVKVYHTHWYQLNCIF